jgi:hypothetical protein
MIMNDRPISNGTDENHGKKVRKTRRTLIKIAKKHGKSTASKCHILIDNAIKKNCVLTKNL